MKLRREKPYLKTYITPETTYKTTISSVEMFKFFLTLYFPNVCKVRINSFFLSFFLSFKNNLFLTWSELVSGIELRPRKLKFLNINH